MENSYTDLKQITGNNIRSQYDEAANSIYNDLFYYNMNHKKQGMAYIFNTELDRKGARVEADNLSTCLRKLGFDVQPFKDLRVNEIKYHVQQVVKMDHSDSNCFLIAVLSHGDQNNQVQARDGFYDPSKMFWEQLTDTNCPSLAGKPKLFLLQCCQGNELDSGITLVPKKFMKTETDGVNETSNYKFIFHPDMCIMYATAKGHLAFRNTVNGSQFIKILCEELMEHAYSTHLLTILTFVIQRIAVDFESKSKKEKDIHNKKKQTPYFKSTLTKLMQFVDNNNNNNIGK